MSSSRMKREPGLEPPRANLQSMDTTLRDDIRTDADRDDLMQTVQPYVILEVEREPRSSPDALSSLYVTNATERAVPAVRRSRTRRER